MPKKGANISLSSYDDIFETDASRAEAKQERIQSISILDLVPFENHPFKVVDDEAMLRTTESIAQYGVLTPIIARPLEDGGYEIISGHRRVHAAEAAGLDEVPVIVRDLLGTILAAYKDFGDRFAIVEEKLPAIDMVRKAALNKIGRFTKQDIREQCPSLSLSSVEAALRKMVASGELKREGTGKSTCYIRLK